MSHHHQIRASQVGGIRSERRARSYRNPRAASSESAAGSETCVVAAYDRGAGLRFSRTGYLYPIVEMHPVHGLLVGVSSGGRFRLPTGDIVWRVDGRPYRELKAANNPASPSTSFSVPTTAAGDDSASRAMRDTVEQALRMSAGLLHFTPRHPDAVDLDDLIIDPLQYRGNAVVVSFLLLLLLPPMGIAAFAFGPAVLLRRMAIAD